MAKPNSELTQLTDEQIRDYATEGPDNLTDNIDEAIFLLRDGTMISGEYEGGYRSVDHNILTGVSPEIISGDPELWSKIHAVTGVVRLVAESHQALIMEGQELTEEQRKALAGSDYEVAAYTPAISSEQAQERKADDSHAMRDTKKQHSSGQRITDEMITHAKRVSIVDIAAKNGIQLIRDSDEYAHWAEHDSLNVNIKKNAFSWNSRSIQGDSIEFMQKVVGAEGFKASVIALNDPELALVDPKLQAKPREKFTYYLKNREDFSRVFDYLTIARGINPGLVNELHRKGFIQEDNLGRAIFVWAKNGTRVGATIQGTRLDYNTYGKRGTAKQIARNSEPNFGFNFTVGQPKQVMVFEAPIDALSYLSLHPDTQDTMLFSMDGLKYKSVKAAMNYAVQQTGLAPTAVSFGVDNDPAGRVFYDEMVTKHAFVDAEGKTLPYLNNTVDDLAIPVDHKSAIDVAANLNHVPVSVLAAVEKAETDFGDSYEVGNGFGFKGGVLNGRDDGGAIDPHDYETRMLDLASQMKQYGNEKDVNMKAYVEHLQPTLDPTLRQQLVGKIESYRRTYEDAGIKTVLAPIKDWNDRLRQVQIQNGFDSKLIDRVFAKQGEESAVRIVKQDDSKHKFKAVTAFDTNIGFYEADSPQEMAYLLKTYGYNAVDKEDERKYDRQQSRSEPAPVRAAAKAASAVQEAAERAM